MRTDGKALHLAVVGLGQAGGNLAAEYYSRGYPALALNTAKADLLALNPGIMYPSLPETSRLYVGLNGYDGAGSDPLYGRECVLEHADTIRSTITQTFAEADAIILCAGLGGGTGSAIGTLAEIIHEVAPPLVGLLTLPSHAESALAKINAVRAVKEVLGTPLSGWIFVDNERIHEACASLPVSAYYKEVNNRIVTPLDSLNNLNSQSTLTPVRTFDDEDFRTLLLSGGILNYAEISLDKLDADTIAQAFLTSLRDSSLMPGNFGTQDLSYVGLIIEAPASILDNVSMSELETLTQILKSETQGSAIYPGIYLSENNSKATLRTLVSCTSVPQGILSLLDAAQTEGDWLRQKITRNAPSLELGDIANLDLLKTRTQSHRRPSPPTTSPTTDRRVSSPSTPAIRRPAVQSRPRPSLQGHQSSLPTELPPVSRRRYGGLAKASSSETSATASEAPRPSPSISDSKNTRPSPSISDSEQTRPQPSVSRSNDIHPNPPTADSEQTLPQPSVSGPKNDIPSKSPTADSEQTSPQPSISRSNDIHPKPPTTDSEQTSPQPSISRQKNMPPKSPIADPEQTSPRPSISRPKNMPPKPLIADSEQTSPQPSISRPKNMPPKPLIADSEQTSPQPSISRSNDIHPKSSIADSETPPIALSSAKARKDKKNNNLSSSHEEPTAISIRSPSTSELPKWMLNISQVSPPELPSDSQNPVADPAEPYEFPPPVSTPYEGSEQRPPPFGPTNVKTTLASPSSLSKSRAQRGINITGDQTHVAVTQGDLHGRSNEDLVLAAETASEVSDNAPRPEEPMASEKTLLPPSNNIITPPELPNHKKRK